MTNETLGSLELRRRDSESVLIRTSSLGAMNHTVAVVIGDTGMAEHESDPAATSPVWVNARLFAAAPDLLAVLASMVDHIEFEHDITNSGGPNWAMRLTNEFGDRYRAAIAKACDRSES